MKQKKAKTNKRIKTLGNRLFAKYFGFEEGIDITNDAAVLYRRNVVIKNIIFLSNMLFTGIFFALSIYRPGQFDWIIGVLTMPITYVINRVLNKLINVDKYDQTKQLVATYVAVLYMFISTMLVYLRMSLDQNSFFETGSYVLIFYSLVVISLYQDRKLLSNSFILILGFITIIHFTITDNLFVQGMTLENFFKQHIRTPEFGDILLRTLVFIVYYFVVYAIVSIGQTMQEERKRELAKRREVQNDFGYIVKDLFSVVFSSSYSLLDRTHAYHVEKIAKQLALFFNVTEEQRQIINELATIHLRFDEIKDIINEHEMVDERGYDALKEKTTLGSKIAKRLQLAQKCEDIVRSHLEGTSNEKFYQEMMQIQPGIEAQIILLSDMYITMRSLRSYKRPYTHLNTLKVFQQELTPYFDYNVKETFLRYNEEFDKLYNQF